jgi:hypothetical protein
MCTHYGLCDGLGPKHTRRFKVLQAFVCNLGWSNAGALQIKQLTVCQSLQQANTVSEFCETGESSLYYKL